MNDQKDIINSGTQKAYVMDNAFFLSIVQSMPHGVKILNSKFEIIMCNEWLYKLLGCKTQEEYINNFNASSRYCQLGDTPSDEMFHQLTTRAYREGRVSMDWMHCDIYGKPIPLNITIIKLDIVDEFGGNFLIGHLHDLRPILKIKERESIFNHKLKAILDAIPLCLQLWDRNFEKLMCNKLAYQLYDLESEQQYRDEFFNLSPKYQPNGRLSRELVIENLKKAFDTGYYRFKWLHNKLNGEEIPTEVTIVKMIMAGDGEELLVSFTRDLRNRFIGNPENDLVQFDEYFFNQIPDRTLFSVLAELSGELFFSYDKRTSLIQFYGKLSKQLNINNKKILFPQGLLSLNVIHPEDHHIFIKLSENINNGISESVDLRLTGFFSEPRYFTISYQMLFNSKQELVFSIGRAVDIHDQRALEVKAKTDLLTGCYNKITAEMEILKILSENEEDQGHVFFIVDIDDFKSINDNLGHYFGDLVLREVANNLKKHFRSLDIVGRVGGDEFVVFVKDIKDMNIAVQKAENIADAFKGKYIGGIGDYKVSCSIGCSVFPVDGRSYEELYKAADKALYESKKRGKDCYTFYSESLMDGTMKNRTVYENAHRYANSHFDTELISTIFNLLYGTKDVKASINAVLQYIGKRLFADRCYIFESFDHGKTYDNTFEWCQEGVNPEIDNLQGLTKEILTDFFEDANTEGILYCNDLTTLTATGAYKLMADQNIKSFLHAQTRSEDYVKNFFGLDDCTAFRVWSEKEINSVMYAKKIITIFLLIEN